MKEIRINVDGWQIAPCWAVAGTRGSFGSCMMLFGFSPDWAGLSKRITFFPADGSDAVALLLKDRSVRVPDEVMSRAGTAEFVIDGIGVGGERMVSERGELRVVDTAEPGGREPIRLTPSEYEQLRAEIAKLEERRCCYGIAFF